MAMAGGSVVVADDGSVTKSGMAEAIYDTFVGNYTADTGEQLPAVPDCIPILTGYATLATNLGQAIVKYITTNGFSVVTATTGGLQNSTAAGNPTDPSGADTFLPIV